MSRNAAFVLFLAIGLGFSCAADLTPPTDDSDTTDVTTTSSTTETTTTTTDTPTTTTTTTDTPTTTTTTTETSTTTTTTTETPTTTTTTETPTTTTTTTTTTSTTEPSTTTTTTTTTESTTTTTTAQTTTPTTTSTAPTTPTTTPSPLPEPASNLYKVKKDNVTCLMVKFGLRIGYKGDKYEEMNFLYTNETYVNGSCGEDNSELLIQGDTLTIKLSFINDTKKFSLHALNVTGKTSSGVAFTQANTNMTLWQASLGSSYMCTKKQNYTITEQLNIFTFELQVQPFGVKKEAFSTAQECSMDDTSILIPIVVGAALAGLILIVVIAYLIGRRKTYVGYQTL